MMEMSSSVVALTKALLDAQKKMAPVLKDATNPAFKSKYANLESVLDAVQPALQSAGIVLIQGPFSTDEGATVGVETMLLHESGEWIKSTLALRPSKTDPQGAGSAITYGRRYSILAMCGVAPEDDDGAAASGPREVPRQVAREPQRTPEPPKTKAKPTDDDAPGSISPDASKRLAGQFALIGGPDSHFTLRDEIEMFKEATNGRVSEPDIALLSQNEARRLYALLKPLVEKMADDVQRDRGLLEYAEQTL